MSELIHITHLKRGDMLNFDRRPVVLYVEPHSHSALTGRVTSYVIGLLYETGPDREEAVHADAELPVIHRGMCILAYGRKTDNYEKVV